MCYANFYLISTSRDTQNQRHKIILPKLYFTHYFISRKVDLQGSVCGLRIRIRFVFTGSVFATLR